MASSIRYAPLQGIHYDIHQNNAPVAVVEYEALFDRFIHSRVIRFRLRNDLSEIIDSAIVTIKFYRHVRSRKVIISSRDELAVAYFALKIRPGDVFGHGMSFPFPADDVDTIEIAVTKVFVVGDGRDRHAVFTDAEYLKPAPPPPRPAPLPDEPPPYQAPHPRQRFDDVSDEDGLAPSPVAVAEAKEQRRSRMTSIIAGVAALALVLPLAAMGVTSCMGRAKQYDSAMALLRSDDVASALPLLCALGDYQDAQQQLYQAGVEAQEAGDFPLALSCFRSAYQIPDAGERYRKWNQSGVLSGGVRHAVALTFGGRVVTASAGAEETEFGQGALEGWENIAGVSAGAFHTVGITADGRAVAAGDNVNERIAVGDWRGLYQVTAGPNTTVGVRRDGNVYALGANDCGQCGVDEWRSILRASCGENHTVAINGLGRARATLFTGQAAQDYGQCGVDGWTGLVDVCAAVSHTLGLHKNGIVAATKYTGPSRSDYGQCDTKDWRDIVAVSATGWHSVGLKKDGTVVATGKNASGECDVGNWENMLAVFAGDGYTLGLCADGTVSVAGAFPEGDGEIKNQIAAWKLW